MGVDESLRTGTKWDRFIYWCGRFLDEPDFDSDERDYKLPIADRLVAARNSLFAGDGQWVDLVHAAIHFREGNMYNNLTSWRQTQPLESWFNAEPEDGALALRLLWNEAVPVRDRFNQFAEVAAAHRMKAPISETAFLHMAMGIEQFPPFRSGRMEMAMDLTGYPTPKDAGIKSGNIGFRYQHFLQFLDGVVKRSAERGITFRDRLDAQSAIWAVTYWDPHLHWTDEDRRTLLAYQGKPFTPQEPGD